MALFPACITVKNIRPFFLKHHVPSRRKELFDLGKTNFPLFVRCQLLLQQAYFQAKLTNLALKANVF